MGEVRPKVTLSCHPYMSISDSIDFSPVTIIYGTIPMASYLIRLSYPSPEELFEMLLHFITSLYLSLHRFTSTSTWLHPSEQIEFPLAGLSINESSSCHRPREFVHPDTGGQYPDRLLWRDKIHLIPSSSPGE